MMLYLVVTNGPEVAPVLKRPAILEKAAGQVNFQPAIRSSAQVSVARSRSVYRRISEPLWKSLPQIDQGGKFFEELIVYVVTG
ncbi:hypothetical protein [Azotobacter salinestris]|uniref:hypothetical protein n=1 Tax=Azotobacter salinestris TaxID=69964 RepID=UPI001266BE2F|nr:hypothetical protein [Azotobacter salinestris]